MARRSSWKVPRLVPGWNQLTPKSGWNDGWLDPAFRDWNIEAELPKIRCPVLAIQGVDDQYATMAQLDRIAAGLHSPCRLLKLASCGHTPQRDQPAAVSTAIAQLYENAADLV